MANINTTLLDGMIDWHKDNEIQTYVDNIEELILLYAKAVRDNSNIIEGVVTSEGNPLTLIDAEHLLRQAEHFLVLVYTRSGDSKLRRKAIHNMDSIVVLFP